MKYLAMMGGIAVVDVPDPMAMAVERRDGVGNKLPESIDRFANNRVPSEPKGISYVACNPRLFI
jgi:hypothetical protein